MNEDDNLNGNYLSSENAMDPNDETTTAMMEEPEFITAEDAVEVVVDDENIPMDDDDDDDNDIEGDENENFIQGGSVQQSIAPDMSQQQFRSHNGPVYSVTAQIDTTDPTTSSSLWVISGGGDDRAYLHQMTATTTTSTLLPYSHTDSVSSTVTNLNCPQRDPVTTRAIIAVAGYDGAILLYNFQAELLQQLEGPTDVEWLAFHPTGTVLLAGSAADGTVWMFHTQPPTATCLQVFVGHESSVTAGGFATVKKAVTASADGTVRVWAPKTGTTTHVFRLVARNTAGNIDDDDDDDDGGGGGGGGGEITCLAMGGGTDGKLCLAGSDEGRAFLLHIGNHKVVATLQHTSENVGKRTTVDDIDDNTNTDDSLRSVEAVGFGPQQQYCATAGVDGILKIWDLQHDTPQCRQTCRHMNGGVTRLQWLSLLPIVVTVTTVGTIHLWDARTGMELQQLSTGSLDALNDLQVVENDTNTIIGTTTIVTAGDDGVVRVFHVNVPELINTSATVATSSAANTIQ